ncbi:MAG: hypothetical protein ACTH2Q_06605 [Propionibacteriaceae bacterium]
METNDEGPPTPEKARIALAQADTEEKATLHRPTPRWYFPALAAIILALFCLNAVEERSTISRIVMGVLVLALAASVGALVGKVTFNPSGYQGIKFDWAGTIPVSLVAVAFPVAAIVLDGIIGRWVWIPAGVVLATLLLTLGLIQQRAIRRG